MVEAARIAPDQRDRINAGVGGVTCVDAETDQRLGQVVHGPVNFIPELDEAARMGVERRVDPVFLMRDLRELRDAPHHALPFRIRQPPGSARSAGGCAPFGRHAIDDDEPGRVKRLEDLAGAPRLGHHIVESGGVGQGIEQATRRQPQFTRRQLILEARDVGREVTDRAEVDGVVARGLGVVEHAVPVRVLRPVGEIDPHEHGALAML